MSNPEPCNCSTSLALAAELAMARARLAEIASLRRQVAELADHPEASDYRAEFVDQVGEVLDERWLP